MVRLVPLSAGTRSHSAFVRHRVVTGFLRFPRCGFAYKMGKRSANARLKRLQTKVRKLQDEIAASINASPSQVKQQADTALPADISGPKGVSGNVPLSRDDAPLETQNSAIDPDIFADTKNECPNLGKTLGALYYFNC